MLRHIMSYHVICQLSEMERNWKIFLRNLRLLNRLAFPIFAE